MKKLLTLLALVLALCTMFVALADTDSEDGGTSYFDPTRIHEVDGHEVDAEGAVQIKKPTCTEKGLWRYPCKDEPTHFHEVYEPALGHAWDKGKVVKEPTCTEKGEMLYTCTVCKATKTEEIKALGHVWSSDEDGTQWGKVTVEPTCISTGEAVDFCKVCGEIRDFVDPRVIDKVPHKFVAVWDEFPTCKDKGAGHFECAYCGLKPTDKEIADGKYTLEASILYYFVEDMDEEGNEYVEAREFEPATDKVAFEVPADDNAHDWDNWVLSEAATCFQPMKYVRWCKICGDKQEKKLTTRDDLVAYGYNPDAYMYEGKYDDNEVPGRLEPVEVSVARLVDCFTQEVTVYCANCAKLNKDNTVDTSKCADGHVMEPFTLPVSSHVYMHSNTIYTGKDKAAIEAAAKKAEKTFAEYVEPTCETDGYFAYKCIYDISLGKNTPAIEKDINFTEHDASTYDKVIVPKLGHDWSEWEVRTAPGEGDNEYGYWLRECERCHKTEEKIAKQQPAEMCGDAHEFLATEEVAATCTADGSITYTCANCGTTKTEKVEKLGHKYTAEVVTEATCAKEGKQLLTCQNCGDTYTEAIKATGKHTLEAVEGKAATCKDTGLEAAYKCTVCGKLFSDAEGKTEIEAQVVIPTDENAHVYETISETKATCTEKGKKIEICSVCGFSKTTELDIVPHSWDEGVITKEATLDEKGEKTYTCTVCGETRTEEIEFEPADESKYDVKDAAFDKDEMVVSGSVELDPTTKPAEKTYARVTFFMSDGTFVAFATIINEDGSFEAMTSGDVIHVAIQVTDSAKVRPGEFNSFGGSEFDVK